MQGKSSPSEGVERTEGGYGGMWWKGCGAGLLQAGGGYEAEGDGFHDYVGGVGGPELAHDVAAVGLNGVLGDVEDRCDLAGVLTVGYQPEHFEFFRGEGGASGPGFAAGDSQ